MSLCEDTANLEDGQVCCFFANMAGGEGGHEVVDGDAHCGEGSGMRRLTLV
jgi:hypothetical protein